MKTGKRILISTIVSFLLLLAVVAAGLNAVFTVTVVKTDFVVYSRKGAQEAEELQEKLDGRFLGKSTTFLNLRDVESCVAAYPCFYLESAEKRFPTGVYLKVTERREAYAVALSADSYAFLDAEGYCLGIEAQNAGRADGLPAIAVSYGEVSYGAAGETVKPFYPVVAETGTAAEGLYLNELSEAFGVLRETLSEPRASVVSIEVKRRGGSEENDFFCVTMREGCVFEIGNPANRIGEKIGMAMRFYLGIGEYSGNDASGAPKGMRDAEKVAGRVTVSDSGMTRPLL